MSYPHPFQSMIDEVIRLREEVGTKMFYSFQDAAVAILTREGGRVKSITMAPNCMSFKVTPHVSANMSRHEIHVICKELQELIGVEEDIGLHVLDDGTGLPATIDYECAVVFYLDFELLPKLMKEFE